MHVASTYDFYRVQFWGYSIWVATNNSILSSKLCSFGELNTIVRCKKFRVTKECRNCCGIFLTKNILYTKSSGYLFQILTTSETVWQPTKSLTSKNVTIFKFSKFTAQNLTKSRGRDNQTAWGQHLSRGVLTLPPLRHFRDCRLRLSNLETATFPVLRCRELIASNYKD